MLHAFSIFFIFICLCDCPINLTVLLEYIELTTSFSMHVTPISPSPWETKAINYIAVSLILFWHTKWCPNYCKHRSLNFLWAFSLCTAVAGLCRTYTVGPAKFDWCPTKTEPTITSFSWVIALSIIAETYTKFTKPSVLSSRNSHEDLIQWF